MQQRARIEKPKARANSRLAASQRPAEISTLSGHKSFGLLVLLGFDIAVFTPAAYQRLRLRRPSVDILSWGWLRA